MLPTLPPFFFPKTNIFKETLKKQLNPNKNFKYYSELKRRQKEEQKKKEKEAKLQEQAAENTTTNKKPAEEEFTATVNKPSN